MKKIWLLRVLTVALGALMTLAFFMPQGWHRPALVAGAGALIVTIVLVSKFA